MSSAACRGANVDECHRQVEANAPRLIDEISRTAFLFVGSAHTALLNGRGSEAISARALVLEATVLAVGPGARNEKGDVIPMSVKTGDRVLLPEYGGTKVVVDEVEYSIFREQDLLGVFH
ncbi:unnamed protein product [Angiostrongylus costaricensis]|uniref:10 kDa heat shock protein, mitochondrial n=1 Tax=Angiostrongylus costaricensis TaxID=334426 RepID=A0A0R3PJF1_ANGCS|nr:unnamed protein product [Angiostrongylus costaricensis]